ncbi:MAG: hypothetical protein OER88_04245 [Planctomycetota bacterium]|nr:hypothetical protein [Planctomycetota bacterium]
MRRWRELPAETARSRAEEALHEARLAMPSDAARAARCAYLAAVGADIAEDNPLAARAWCKLGEVRMARAHPAAALRAYDCAFALAVSGRSEARVARIEIMRLRALLALRRYVELRSSAQACLDRCDRLDDPIGRVHVHLALGDLALRFRRKDEALRHYDEVAALMPSSASASARDMLTARRARASS